MQLKDKDLTFTSAREGTNSKSLEILFNVCFIVFHEPCQKRKHLIKAAISLSKVLIYSDRIPTTPQSFISEKLTELEEQTY